MPTDSWLNPEFLEDPLMTDNVVIDHILISGASFIVHGPSSIDKLKLTIGNQFLNLRFLLITLVIPPHFEKLHLYLREFSGRVILESIHYGGKFKTNTRELDVFSSTVEILIESLEPSNVIMRVRDNMNRLWSTTLVFIVSYFKVVVMELAVVHCDTS